MSNPEISEKDSPAYCAALCIIWQGQPLKYIAGFCSSTLVLMESRTPMLTEVLSTPTEVHNIQGFGQFRRLPNLTFIVL